MSESVSQLESYSEKNLSAEGTRRKKKAEMHMVFLSFPRNEYLSEQCH